MHSYNDLMNLKRNNTEKYHCQNYSLLFLPIIIFISHLNQFLYFLPWWLEPMFFQNPIILINCNHPISIHISFLVIKLINFMLIKLVWRRHLNNRPVWKLWKIVLCTLKAFSIASCCLRSEDFLSIKNMTPAMLD